MAKDLRHDDSNEDRLNEVCAALVLECEREEENCLYTSTSFFIWVRCLRYVRAILWIGAVAASAVAASHILRGDPSYRILMAAAALGAVILPGIGRAVRIDASIREYAAAAASFKNLQSEFRRAAQVWSLKPYPEFESEARKLFRLMNETRKPSLTPPELCFRLARWKVRRGHYEYNENSK